MAVRSKSTRRADNPVRPEASARCFEANAARVVARSYGSPKLQLAKSIQQNAFTQACCSGWPTETAQEALASPPRPRPRPETNGISEVTLNKLTPKQEAFVREYLVDLNGAAAARRAGYSENSAKQIASENLTKPDVMMAIEEAFASLGGITRIRIVDELGAIAFADIGEFVDWDNEVEHVAADLSKRMNGRVELQTVGTSTNEVHVITNRVVVKPSSKLTREQRRAVSKITQDRYGNVRIEMHDKLGALKMLGTALGMFSESTGASADTQHNNYSATIIYSGRPNTRPTPRYASSETVRRSGENDD
jgi:phage terminase small subunit